MSPNNKKKLLTLRKKLDLIDDKLLNLLKIRAEYVKKVLSLKEFKKEVIDRKRINIILKNIKKNLFNIILIQKLVIGYGKV